MVRAVRAGWAACPGLGAAAVLPMPAPARHARRPACRRERPLLPRLLLDEASGSDGCAVLCCAVVCCVVGVWCVVVWCGLWPVAAYCGPTNVFFVGAVLGCGPTKLQTNHHHKLEFLMLFIILCIVFEGVGTPQGVL